jgi:AmmeMemoRadiSam system protein B
MTSLRPPAVAGSFYPDNPAVLAAVIEDFLAEAALPPRGTPPKAIIAPHAGYIYSGPVAAWAYAAIQPLAGRITRVVLLGPAHYVRLTGLAAPVSQSFETPLGRIPVDQAALDATADLPQVTRSEAAHEPEHSLEVQLPFLKLVLGDFALVPLAVGDATAREVAVVLDRLWGGTETLIVISSDLSHYHAYQDAKARDAATAAAIEAFDGARLGPEDACGRAAVAGFLVEAERRGLSVERLDLRNSGDTAGTKVRVVGYGAWAFWEGFGG